MWWSITGTPGRWSLNPKTRADVAQQPDVWRKRLLAMPVERLVFGNETGAKTNMMSHYARAKKGVRAVDCAPHGQFRYWENSHRHRARTCRLRPRKTRPISYRDHPVTQLLEVRDSRQLERLHKRLQRNHLLVLDEFGYVPFSKTGAELLFEVFSRAYERTASF